MAKIAFRSEICDEAGAEELFARSFAANFGRQDHDPIEIAEALDRMVKAGKTHEQIARVAGRSGFWVSTHLRLLTLHPKIQELLVPGRDGKAPLKMSGAVSLFGLPEKSQLKLVKEIEKGEPIDKLRKIIEREKKATGTYNEKQSRRSMFNLIGVCNSVLTRVANYVDLPAAELGALVDAATPSLRLTAAKNCREISDLMGALAKSIDKRSAGHERKSA
jgi:ParB-like chromosome segregation protein Spo0J